MELPDVDGSHVTHCVTSSTAEQFARESRSGFRSRSNRPELLPLAFESCAVNATRGASRNSSHRNLVVTFKIESGTRTLHR
jgi:hypothetical protein